MVCSVADRMRREKSAFVLWLRKLFPGSRWLRAQVRADKIANMLKGLVLGIVFEREMAARFKPDHLLVG